MKTIMHAIFKFILATGIVISSLLPQFAVANGDIAETAFAKPEDVFPLVEKFINANDLYGFISLFPIEALNKENKFVDIVLKTGSYNPNAMFRYLHIFDSSRTTAIVNDNAGYFIAVKSTLASFYYDKFGEATPVKTEMQAKAIQANIEAAVSKKIKLVAGEKHKGTMSSIFKSKEIYVFESKLFAEDGTLLSDKGSLRVEKINGKWRLTYASLT